MEKELEDAGIKLSSVATDILGVSARAMLRALIEGERDVHILARRMCSSVRPCPRECSVYPANSAAGPESACCAAASRLGVG